MQRLLLLGAGHAHLQLLRALAAAPLRDAAATLVSPYPLAVYSGMVPGLLAGHYALPDASIPIGPLAAAAAVRFVEAAATVLDAARRRVTLDDGSVVDYDLLSLDTGAVVAREAIAGAAEHAWCVRPIEAFVRRFDELGPRFARQGGELAVIGAGAAGVELAMALRHRLPHARVTLVTGGPEPLAGYASGVQRRAQHTLRRRGIEVRQQACVAIDAARLHLDDTSSIACDLPLLATGAAAPRWLAGSGLALDAQGFVATGPTLQSRSHADVFAVGDVASRSDVAHPKSGVYAVRAGPPLIHNLRAAVAGAALIGYTPQRRSLNLLSCGSRYAIASWGGWSAQGPHWWWLKDRIDRGFVAGFRPRLKA